MKNKTLLLLKMNLINTYKLKDKNKKKLFLIFILIIYVAVVLFISIKNMMVNLINTLIDYNLLNYYLTLLFTIASIMACIFSIFFAKSKLFDNKDNNLLLSLPVSKKNIFYSRFLNLTIYNFLIGLILIIPGLIVYFQNTEFITFSTILYILIGILLFSIIPGIVASVFGYFVALLTSKVKKKNVFEIVFYILFIILYYLLVSKLNAFLMLFINNVKLLNIILKTCFFPIYTFYKYFITSNILYLILYLLSNIVLLYLFSTILSKNYFKIISSLSSHTQTSNYKMRDANINSKRKALIKKELKQYFASAIYVFNTALGPFLLVIAGVASLFFPPIQLISLINMTELINSPFILVLALLLFSVALTNTTNSSISMEKNSFWIIKSIPIEIKDIFYTKRFVNKLILVPASVVSLTLFYISNYITFVQMILLIVISFLFNHFISNFGLIINLMYPKFDAINDTVIVKQSVSTMITILGGMGFAVVLISLSKLEIKNIYFLLLMIAIMFVLSFASNLILNKYGRKKFVEL